MQPTLSEDAIARAADALVAARLTNTVIDGLPEDAQPRTLADAYAIQDALINRLGWAVGGWYCACTNPEIQRLLGLDEPYYARLLERFILESPAELRADEFPPMVLECEFAFRLGRDLPARAEPYGREEVLAAVASVHPAIEVVAGHLKDWPQQDVFAVIADNGTDGALIHGAPAPGWPGLDLAAVAVTLSVNGTLVQHGSGANVLGDPATALVWLANARSRAGEGLKAGQIHNTGTATPIQPAQRGDAALADFGALGTVALTIR